MRIAPPATRTTRGAFIAELPVALWMLILGFTFPLVDLSIATMRTTLVLGACRDGVHEAARSKTFQTSISASELSSQQSALNTVNQVASRFHGIRITSVNTFIIRTDINTQVSTRYASALTQPADSSAYVYNIETVVVGQADPLVTFNIPFFGNIPGLTGPMTVSAAAREFAEYPQGLNQ